MSLFSGLSIRTMVHGIALGGGAMMALFGAMVLVYAMGKARQTGEAVGESARLVGLLSTAAATLLWATVIAGTYVIFPPYRATPPEGTTDLTGYPRSLIQADPSTAWLHSFAMEIKEHVPWIAAMLVTAVAFVATRHRGRFLKDATVQRAALLALSFAFALSSAMALLGVFINKVAPVQ
jgi:hypothetical protein